MIPITADAAAATTPQAMNPTRGPYMSVTQPTSGAPSGVPPTNTIMNRLITRPRMAGAVAIWMPELAVTLIVRPNMPIGTSSAAKSQNCGASAAVISSRPKVIAAPMSSRSREVPRRAASRAPTSEPPAIRVLSMPYVPAPAWKTSSTKAVSQIGKLKPKVPMKPTRTMGHSSSGRPAT